MSRYRTLIDSSNDLETLHDYRSQSQAPLNGLARVRRRHTTAERPVVRPDSSITAIDKLMHNHNSHSCKICLFNLLVAV